MMLATYKEYQEKIPRENMDHNAYNCKLQL
jgi:hypothetical protein